MWNFNNEIVSLESEDTVELHERYDPSFRIYSVDHRDTQYEMLKVLIRHKSMSIVELAKKTKITTERVTYEIPSLPKEFFRVEGNIISLSDCVFNMTEKELKKKFRKDV